MQPVRGHLHPDAVTKSNQAPFEVTRVQGVHGIVGRYNFAGIKFISRGHYFKHITKNVICLRETDMWRFYECTSDTTGHRTAKREDLSLLIEQKERFAMETVVPSHPVVLGNQWTRPDIPGQEVLVFVNLTSDESGSGDTNIGLQKYMGAKISPYSPAGDWIMTTAKGKYLTYLKVRFSINSMLPSLELFFTCVFIPK